MRRRTSYYETLDDDTEVELEFEAIEGTLLQAQIGDKYVVAYCVQDDGDGCNPMKDYDGNGTLITDGRDHVITDGDPAQHLGLSALGRGYRTSELEHDLESDEVRERAEQIVRALVLKSERLRVLSVTLALMDVDPITTIMDELEGYNSAIEFGDDGEEAMQELPSYKVLCTQAWEELYAEGKIGTYLAVPVNYCDSNHGPGTTSIDTTSLDNANAVWVPGQCEIDNMSFPDGATYLEKLAVAEKYAKSCLDEYEKWCNGEVYGCVVQVHDAEGKMLGPEEACWGFIGWKWAEEALRTEFFEPTCERLRKEEAA